jgi:integrase
VFATWALAQPGARIEDVSRLLGHSTVRVTQDLYIAPDADLYDRFYQATRMKAHWQGGGAKAAVRPPAGVLGHGSYVVG